MDKEKINRDASLTAVIPLWARAEEGRSDHSLFNDMLAADIWDNNPYISPRKPIVTESENLVRRFTQTEIAIRTKIIDDIIGRDFKTETSRQFLNIGAGLCTRGHRLGASSNFHESDSTSGLAFRNKILGLKSKGESQIKIDLTIPIPVGYIREKTGNYPLTVICEGTLMYFEKNKAISILDDLANLAGEGGRVVVEIMGSAGQKMTHPMVKRINPELVYKWGEDGRKPLEKAGFKVIAMHNVWKGYEKKWGPIAHLVKWWPGGRYSFGSFIMEIEGKNPI
jgi:O-methyltransferase involved in polyketide biosynthesis